MNGTEAGTRQLEINPGGQGSFPAFVTSLGGNVFMAANDGAYGSAFPQLHPPIAPCGIVETPRSLAP